MSNRPILVLAGALAQKPGYGGHTWVFLQYLLGFKRLGWDILFLDELEPAQCVDDTGVACPFESSQNLRYFQAVMERFGLSDSFALSYNRGEHRVGVPRAEVRERVRQSTFLLNVMGFLKDEDILGQAPRRVFLDIDPGFAQMWKDLHLADVFRGHDDFVTIGENIGQVDCLIPTCGLKWVTTPQPVVLDYWPFQVEPSGDAFTSVASWRGAYGPVEYHGRIYGLRVHEFRKFVELPRRTGTPFHLALDIHPAENMDLVLLAENGWILLAPAEAVGDPWNYQAFIRSSAAEFMVAKNMYVASRSGWFSDRSICYLASGKPVLVQDTGIRHLYPTSEGLVTFRTPAEAVAGVEAIMAHYARHARAARAIAEECFDSDKVLRRLIGKLGLG
jgi:hypothetical protein